MDWTRNLYGRIRSDFGRTPQNKQMKKTITYLTVLTLLLLVLAGVLTTICVLVEAIYLMSGGI